MTFQLIEGGSTPVRHPARLDIEAESAMLYALRERTNDRLDLLAGILRAAYGLPPSPLDRIRAQDAERAKIRLADEYDAAQAAGEVASRADGDRSSSAEGLKPTVAEVGQSGARTDLVPDGNEVMQSIALPLSGLTGRIIPGQKNVRPSLLLKTTGGRDA